MEWISWFIEHKETHLWWAGQDKDDSKSEPVWTNDPLRAYPFDYKYEAEIRAFAFKLDQITIATEHKFVGPTP